MMNFAGLLLLAGLMGTVWGQPVKNSCPKGCEHADNSYNFPFKHVAAHLSESSVAPWDYEPEKEEGRIPEHIDHAKCRGCNVTGMSAKPIFFQISVARRVKNNNDSNSSSYCICPHKVAVGCTCSS